MMNFSKTQNNENDLYNARWILYHLFKHPLFETTDKASESLRICQLGLGEYGKMFLSTALQCGQIVGKHLEIDVFSKRIKSEKKHYLDTCPALKDFFDIDAEKPSDGNYGSLNFKEVEFSDSRDNNNSDKLMHCAFGDNKSRPLRCNYIFIALGSDSLNREIAKQCASLKPGCPICYAVEEPGDEDMEQDKLYPVYTDNTADTRLKREIDRMAFNCHLTWKQDLNVDIETEMKRFKEDYNYYSCVSNIISIQSKLYGVDLEFDADLILKPNDIYDVAELFNSSISSVYREQLIWIEHRRWVVEKLVLGYTKMTVNECVPGRTHDLSAKKHICLVKSTPKSVLPSDDFSSHDPWENISRDHLDELDKVSYDLQQHWETESAVNQDQHLLSSELMARIRSFGADDLKSASCFSEWFNCMIDILGKKRPAAKKYHLLKDKYIGTLPNNKVESAKRSIRQFENLFLPFAERLLFRNFKAYDTDLVDKIPFILTFHADLCLVAAILPEDKCQVYEMIGAAILLNPRKLCFVYPETSQAKDVEKRAALRKRIRQLLASKKLQTTIESDTIEQVSRNPERLSSGCTQTVLQVPSKNCSDSQLNDFRKAVPESWGIISIDTAKMSVTTHRGRNGFAYINKHCYLTALDLAQFSNAQGESVHPEFSKDIDELWKLFISNKEEWKKLCGTLKKTNQTECVLEGALNKSPNSGEQLSYLLPDACYETVRQIQNFLIVNKLAVTENFIYDFSYSSNSFMLTVSGVRSNSSDQNNSDQAAFFNQIFSYPYALSRVEQWDLFTIPNRTARVTPKHSCTVNKIKNDADRIANMTLRGQLLSNAGANGRTPIDLAYTISSEYRDKVEQLIKLLSQNGTVEQGCIMISKNHLNRHGKEDFTLKIDCYVRGVKSTFSNFFDLVFKNANLLKHVSDWKVKVTDRAGQAIASPQSLSVKKATLPNECEPLLRKLNEKGFIRDYHNDKNGKKSFSYATSDIRHMLTNEGFVFEIRLYNILKNSNLFDEVVNGFTIYWQDKHEFDLVVTKGMQTALIECKATNELSDRFYSKLRSFDYGVNCKKIIAAYTLDNAKNQRLIERNSDIITVYKREDLEDFGKTLKKIFDGDYPEP